MDKIKMNRKTILIFIGLVLISLVGATSLSNIPIRNDTIESDLPSNVKEVLEDVVINITWSKDIKLINNGVGAKRELCYTLNEIETCTHIILFRNHEEENEKDIPIRDFISQTSGVEMDKILKDIYEGLNPAEPEFIEVGKDIGDLK